MKKQKEYFIFGLILSLFLFSCNDENEVTYEIKTLPTSVFPNETFALEMTPSTTGWSFSSKNNNIASVTDSGVVTTHYTGITMLYAHHSASGSVDSVQVTVNPRKNYYTEPFLLFNSSMQTVESNETDYIQLLRNQSDVLNYTKDYGGKGVDYYAQYTFNSNGEYHFCRLLFDKYYSDEIISQIAERYLFVRQKDCIHFVNVECADRYYVNPDSTIIITVSHSKIDRLNTQTFVWYHPFSVQSMEIIENDTVGGFFDQ